MYRPTVRRLSMAVLLAAALWLAVPGPVLAGPLEMTAPAILASGLFGRLWQWLDDLSKDGSAPAPGKCTMPTSGAPGEPVAGEQDPNDPKGEQGGMIDPDG